MGRSTVTSTVQTLPSSTSTPRISPGPGNGSRRTSSWRRPGRRGSSGESSISPTSRSLRQPDRMSGRRPWSHRSRGTGAVLTEGSPSLNGQLAAVGEDVEVEPPFRCDYGTQLVIGAGVYINVGCVVLDCAQVVIGDRALLGPGVHIYAATHPV